MDPPALRLIHFGPAEFRPGSAKPPQEVVVSDRTKRPSDPTPPTDDLIDVPIEELDDVAVDDVEVDDALDALDAVESIEAATPLPESSLRRPRLSEAWDMDEMGAGADVTHAAPMPVDPRLASNAEPADPVFGAWDDPAALPPAPSDAPESLPPEAFASTPSPRRPGTAPIGTRGRSTVPPPAASAPAPAGFFDDVPPPVSDDDWGDAPEPISAEAAPEAAPEAPAPRTRVTAPPPQDWEVPDAARRSRNDIATLPPVDAPEPPAPAPRARMTRRSSLPPLGEPGAGEPLASGSGDWAAQPSRPRRPTTMPPPLPRRGETAPPAPPEPPAEPTIFNDQNLFRAEVQRLAKTRDWQRLAAITSAALDEATWAKAPETRAALLEDQARIYRDRLKDVSTAEDVFNKLLAEQPGNAAAIEFLAERQRERGDHRALYDLYASAIEATWDPDQRLAWTRESVRLAEETLHSAELALAAWERLDRLGDAPDETQRALSAGYRTSKKWAKLAEFLTRRADKQQGVDKVVTLREVAEAYLTGLRDQEKARGVLEQILALRPQDTVSLLALARVLAGRKQWDDLAALSDRATAEVQRGAALDFHRLVGDALWSAGELDRAVVEHERILALLPDDADALRAKEQYLERTSRHAELVGFLAERAAKEPKEEARLALLARAAELAERSVGDAPRAIALWEQHAQVPAGRLPAFRALERLYGQTGDAAGVARALEGQLGLVRDRGARIELLRRLGEHAAHRQGDDARAESCWKELLSLAPEDRNATEELSALQRRRGDFEGLDRTLIAQGWRATDDGTMLGLWRAAAANVEAHLGEPARAAAAWRRVLDLAPDDGEALTALARHRKGAGAREAIFALEDRLRATSDAATRLELGLALGALHEEAGDTQGAMAAYERLLCWAPRHDGALVALARLHAAASPAVAQGALDAAAAASDSPSDRLGLAQRAAALVPEGDARARFAASRRLLWLSGREAGALAALTTAAAAAGAWIDLAAVLELLASDDDATARAARLTELAKLVEDKLGDKPRAFLTLQQIGQDPVTLAGALEALARLADATGRHEDQLALLDVVARGGAPADTRTAALRQRAAIMETKLNDPERAFHEHARLLALDPKDAQALGEAKRLAAARALWHKLDALYVELSDRAGSVAERVALLAERHGIHALRLENPSSALDLQLHRYRLEPEQSGARDALFESARGQGAWDRVLPLLEGRTRADGAQATPAELARLAALHETERKDAARALELYAEAFVLDPTAEDAQAHLERLAGAVRAHELLAIALRLGAARAETPARRLAILRRVAAIYNEDLGRPDEALDVHRRILKLDPHDMASLEVIIGRERQRGAWQPLREALGRWVELTTPGAAGAEHATATATERVARLAEIAQLSREHLADPDTALSTYAQILDLEPDNEAALAGVRSLTEGQGDPVLEGRRLRLQLGRAQGAQRIDLMLALARLHEEETHDLGAAITTLQGLVAEAGPAGPGFEPLARLLEKEQDWPALLDLHEARAAALPDAAARAAAWKALITLAELHPDAAPGAAAARLERLCQRLLEERADDEDGSARLRALYRATNRHAELASVLEKQLGAGAAAADDDAARARGLVEGELARLYDCGLGRLADAERLQTARLERAGDGALAFLPALASLRLRQGDFAGYVARRTEAARRQGGAVGALILCHLAEASDERGEPGTKIADLYREARQLDAQCAPANEALKAIGRRSKNWRQGAALLADADEAKLTWAERATRLKAKGDALSDGDPASARAHYLRAVAVDPDHAAAWDALARLAQGEGDDAAVVQALEAALDAYERATPPDAARLGEHAERLSRLAAAHAAAGAAGAAAGWSRRAYELSPSSPAAALAVADLRLAEGDTDGAHAIYDRVLATRENLSPADKLHALYQRGLLSARLGKIEAAIADLRDTLRQEPLHEGALNALAAALATAGRDTAAVQHYVQSLLVAADERHRGKLLAELARLWEERLGLRDEADACIERALSLDPDDRALLTRGLKLYAAAGRSAQALAVIEKLLPGASDPKDLASLWTSRGELLSANDQDRAIEAFDMALSYDPGAPTALSGLAKLLEARGEWAQLLDIFEARTETGSPEERAAALRQLARIAGERLNDAPRAERYLKQAIDLAPEPADYEQLLSLYGQDPARERERRDVIAGLLATSGPWAARLGELGKRLADAGDRRLAWCLLSPLAGFSIPDNALKALVLELRKELEKADNVDALAPDLHARVRPAQLPAALVALLAEIDTTCTLGPAMLEDVGAQAAGKADARTALGKSFAALAERLGLPGAVLYRAGTLPGAPLRILDGDTPQVLVRSELLQLLPLPEINLLFTMLIELARPGARLIAALPPEEAAALLPALLAAAPGPGDQHDPVIAAVAGRIRAGTDEATRAAWAARLAEIPEVAGDGGVSLGRRLQALTWDAARRVALVGTPDLRTAARLLTRLDEAGPKQPSGGPLAELDAFIAQMPALKALVGYAASVEFGRVLSGM